MNIIFMGTPEFALPTLKALHQSSHTVLSVITQPDKPKGRGQKLLVSPIKQFALDFNLPVLQPKTVNDPEFIHTLNQNQPDFIIVVAFGQILSETFLKIPKQFCINLHSSLLPKYRGAAPIHRSILNGDTRTGVTSMIMDKGMDTGDILLMQETPIHKSDNAQTLHDTLSEMGGNLVLETLVRLEQNTLLPTPQNNNLATYAPKLKKEEGLVRWEKNANTLFNQVRGLTPWPGSYTLLNKKRLRILKAQVTEGTLDDQPGQIARVTDIGIEVGTGQDRLVLTELQPEGKKSMSAKSFLAGHKIERGTLFDSNPTSHQL
ncbi:MAG: methionyl-tRNA formyltransferase [Nitrospinaceae bacterium]|nr:methionyl-tRNA formyltransferase [Nitrospina sp.]MBT5377362.1 methionyl-tRNA formyltransferase [Nitrospinaceae bacterium]MBT5867315.1 methionyl-tRNA formyltransferase [Nitrospinaceae bacterium]